MAKRRTNRPVHYRQDVTIMVSVIIDGTEQEFDVLTDDLTAAVEEFVQTLVPKALKTNQFFSNRGPSGSRYFYPGEDIDRDGIHVRMADLGVPTVETD